MLTIDQLTDASAKELCRLFGQDPNSPVAVPSELAGVTRNVPLWETVTPQIREFLLMNEAVKAAMRAHMAERASVAPNGTIAP